jgi:hypothetical protein
VFIRSVGALTDRKKRREGLLHPQHSHKPCKLKKEALITGFHLPVFVTCLSKSNYSCHEEDPQVIEWVRARLRSQPPGTKDER